MMCTLLLLPLFGTFVAAEQTYMPIPEIIQKQGEIDPQDTIYNPEYYDKSLEGCDLSDATILKLHLSFPYHSFLSEGIDAIREGSLSEIYQVIQEPFLTVKRNENGTFSKYEIDYYEAYGVNGEVPPTYLRDILTSAVYESELHVDGTQYTEIICYEGTMLRKGTAVYYVFGDDALVRYYGNPTAEPVDFTLADFVVYATAYYESMKKYGHMDGGGDSFLTFVENNSIEELQKEDENNQVYIWIGIGAVLVAGASVAIWVFSKKKKKTR